MNMLQQADFGEIKLNQDSNGMATALTSNGPMGADDSGYYETVWLTEGYYENVWIEEIENYWVEGYYDELWIDEYWVEEWVPESVSQEWVEGGYHEEWVDGYYRDEWIDDGYYNYYWDEEYQDWVEVWVDAGYYETVWEEGYYEETWVDGYYQEVVVEGHYESIWVDGHSEKIWVEGYYEEVDNGHFEEVWVEGESYQEWVNVNDAPEGDVSVWGALEQGQTLSVSAELLDADGMGAVTYEWMRGNEVILGATGQSYTLKQADVGQEIYVQAIYTDGHGTVETVFSPVTGAVANIDDEASGVLSVKGQASEGGSLSATLGNVSDLDGATTTAYQWQVNNGTAAVARWQAIGAASKALLSIPSDQSLVGKSVRVVATTTDKLGGTTEFVGTAQTVANVNDAPTGGVAINGTATRGQVLKASSTLADADGLGTVSYQWLRAGTAIKGATGASYTLTQADIGQKVSVMASYVDGFGTSESVTSATTAAVQDDSPGVVFTNSANLSVTEEGGSASFQVALRAQPRHDVVLSFAISDATEGVFAAMGKATLSLTFTASNWSAPQTVKLLGVDDKPNDGDMAFVISTSVKSNDLRYDGMRSGSGLPIANLTVINADDDAPDEIYGDVGGSATADLLRGRNGASDVYGLNGRDELYGGKGDDRLYGGYGDDVLYGEADDDELEGDQGNDKLYGDAGLDTLTGGTGKDSLYGGEGNDVLDGSSDTDSMDGGNGADVYYADNAGDVVKDSGTDGAKDVLYLMAYLAGGYTLGAGIDNGVLDALARNGKLTGNTGNNVLTGNASDNALNGGDGADTLNGGDGADSLNGGVGNDELYAGSGNDAVDAGDGDDTLVGGDGAGNDSYAGGNGADTIKYVSAVAGITVNLGTGLASGTNIGNDTLGGIEHVIGGQSGDRITGNAVANSLDGYSGDDTLDGGAGNDTLDGGAGNDTYVVDATGDVVKESSTKATEIDTVQSAVAWTLGANVENLTLTGSKALNGTGNALNNTLTGNSAANVLDGGAGNDTLDGGAGNDTYVVDATGDVVKESSTKATEIDTVQSAVAWTLGANVENLTLTGSKALNGMGNALNNTLTGNTANNALDGGSGHDVLIGGGGTDRFTGGSGNDTFRFATWSDLGLGTARDVVTDFFSGQDKIDLSAIDASAAKAGDQAFAFVTSGFGKAAWQVTYANGIVSINTDTDTAAEYEIQLIGKAPGALSALDFVL